MHSRSLRDNALLHLPKVKSSMGQSTFQYSAAADWNSLPRSLRESKSLAAFKCKIYSYLSDLDRTIRIDLHVIRLACIFLDFTVI